MQTLTQFLKRLARWLGLGAETESGDPLVDLAQKIEPRAGLEALVLTDSQKAMLENILERARQEPGSRGDGTIVLFTGADGTKKVATAAGVAKDLQRDLYRVDLSKVVSKYIGETEKNLRLLLSAAERTQAILFFDEADPLFGKRSEVKDSHDRYANIEINYLLQRLTSYQGISILTSNDEKQIEVLHRLRFVIDFPYPSQR